jgi:hypothetical protein
MAVDTCPRGGRAGDVYTHVRKIPFADLFL